MSEVMIFKAGKYPQGDWPKERVQRLVDAYDPEASYEAPVVIGHRAFGDDDTYQFAHGWVKSVRMDGSGKVYAVIEDFSADVKRAVAEKKLRYMSVEIYEYDKEDAGAAPYLRAIALLGRDTPAVAGAKLPSLFTSGGIAVFATDEGGKSLTTFTRKMGGDDIKEFSGPEPETDGAEENKNLTFGSRGNSLEERMDELEKLKSEFAASNERIAVLQKENAELRNAERQGEAKAFFSKLRDEGKVTPAVFDRAVALDAKLDEEGRKDFRALFGDLQTQVDLSGSHAAPKNRAPEPSAHSAGLTEKIRAYQKEHNIASFEDAAGAMYAANPAVFEKEGGAE